MTRCIPITNCNQCPSKSHKGAFGHIPYIPMCTAMHGKIIPYTVCYGDNIGQFASAKDEIPEWCPLPKFKE